MTKQEIVNSLACFDFRDKWNLISIYELDSPEEWIQLAKDVRAGVYPVQDQDPYRIDLVVRRIRWHLIQSMAITSEELDKRLEQQGVNNVN